MTDDVVSFLSDGDRSLHILFGSQTGNSEDLAVKFGKRAKSYGLESTVHDMDGFDLASLASMSRVLVICSTWGEGEQPDNAEDLWNDANGDGAPSLSKTNFSVCALGDTSYEFFCESGKQWDNRFEQLGGSRLVARVDCDVDYDKPAAEWGEKALAHMAAVDGSGSFQEAMVESISSFVQSGGVAEASAPVAEVPTSSDSGTSGSLEMDGDRSLLILFGSQSGNSEGVCVKVSKMASKYGLEPTIKSMDEIQISEIPGHKRVMIVCSTWGEGDMPDNAEELWVAANGTSAPDLTGTHFSVLALGDTDYEYFCQSGKDWDEWFEKQGALRLVPRVDCDVDYDALAESWMLEVLPHLAAVDGNGTFQADAVETFKLKAAGGQTSTGEVVGAVGDLQGFTIPVLELENVSATLILHRYDPDERTIGTDEIEIIDRPGSDTLYEVLSEIQMKIDASLCLHPSDGSGHDGRGVVRVNGRLVVADRVRIADLVTRSNRLEIKAPRGLPIIRDLLVDLQPIRSSTASAKPWMRNLNQAGRRTASGVVIGVADPLNAVEVHTISCQPSATLAHCASDTVPHSPIMTSPPVLQRLWARMKDERSSNESDKHIDKILSHKSKGVFAETDLSSYARHGFSAKQTSSGLLAARRYTLSKHRFSGRSGRHVKWFAKTVKSSGRLNEAIVTLQTLGPLGMLGNLGVTIRMATGFTRNGAPMVRSLQDFIAPGSLPKLVQTKVEQHHQIVALFSELEQRL